MKLCRDVVMSNMDWKCVDFTNIGSCYGRAMQQRFGLYFLVWPGSISLVCIVVFVAWCDEAINKMTVKT